MSAEKEWKVEGGTLLYEIRRNEVTVRAGRISGSKVTVPETIEGVPVTELDKKAFLSSKLLREVYLPRSLNRIGDWAFAYCSGLEKVTLPERRISFGKGVFKDCERLLFISRWDLDTQKEKQISRLLGAVPGKLEADYLLDLKEAGKEHWLSRFDDKLKEFLKTPDEEGYTKMVYCGEEDIVANMDLYLAKRRREKAALCFLRLINDPGLSLSFREELSAYLARHTKGCDSQAAWEVVFYDHGNEQEYYAAFAQAGCLTEKNYDSILSEMGSQYPEMKGYLMRYQSQSKQTGDFFDLLSFD